MKTKLSLAILLGFLLIGCGNNEEAASPAGTNENYSSGNPVTAPIDYLGAVNKAKKSAERTIDVTSLKTAIALFQAQEDRYPANLNELVQKKYIREIPAVPAGSTINYNPQSGEVQIVRAQ